MPITDNFRISDYSVFEEYSLNGNEGILVNTVNCEGFMGKGLALEFKIRFGEEYYGDYKSKCESGLIQTGRVDYFESHGLKIINFPTKNYFKFPSKAEWIEKGLIDFRKKIMSGQFHNEKIYFPKLGALNGGLNWSDTKMLMKNILKDIDAVEIVICEDVRIGEFESEQLRALPSFLLSKRLIDDVNSISVTRLRDMLELKGVGEKTYNEFINSLKVTGNLKLFE